jgi:hypothetical protein
MAPNGATLYDLETNGDLWQITVGVGWTLLDANDVLSFAMAPSGTTVFALEGNGNRLVKYRVGIGWTLIDSDVQTWEVVPGQYGPDTIYVADYNGSTAAYPM